MNKFPTIKLEEVATITDCPHSTPKWVDGEGVFAVRNFNLLDGRIVKDRASFVSTETYTKRTRRAAPQRGDSILSREAPIGSVGYVNNDDRMCLGQRVVLIHPNDKIDGRFLVYQLLSPYVQNQFKQSDGTGAVVSNLRIPLLKRIQIRYPNIKTQKKIGNIIATYDDFIENNEKRIAALEQLARCLYVEWFVNFKFPGHKRMKMVDSESTFDSIPSGWKVATIGDIANEIRDTVSPNNLEPSTAYVGLEHIPRKKIILSDWGQVSEVQSNKLEFVSGDVLFGKIRPYFHKVVTAPMRGVASSDTIVIRARDKKYQFLVLLAVSGENFVAYATSCSQGTKMPRADWKSMSKYPILIPDEGLLEDYSNRMMRIISFMNSLMFQNRCLSEIRNLLIRQLSGGKHALK
ncbi:restriction endonuclease subunit S [Patescibacteria group bacterium]